MACYNLPKRGRKGVNNICVHYVLAVFDRVLLIIKSTIKFTIEVCAKRVWLTERMLGFPAGLEQGIDKKHSVIDVGLKVRTKKFFEYFT
jgi:hypothetical protein